VKAHFVSTNNKEPSLMKSLVKILAQTTLALSILCVTAFAQAKPKAAVYIMGNPEGRDAIRAAVNTFLIKSGKYQMIAVDAIDVVAQEQRRQLSGAVSDRDIAALGRDAGAQYVCVVQRSELDGVSYVATRMVSVQSKVAELADIVELPVGGKVIDIIQWQIGSMLGMAVGPRPTGSSSGYATRPAQTTYQTPVQTSTVAVSTSTGNPPIQGTLVPGNSLGQKLVWLQKSADSHNTYIVDVNTDESITPYTFEFKGGIDITVVLRGVGGNRTIRLSSHGTMFTVKKEVTFVLDNNITLKGHSSNKGSMVRVEGGEFRMNAGATITGNTITDAGGWGFGSGVLVNGGTFNMSGGIISGNKCDWGGGVHIYPGTFNMSGGTISGNSASEAGGGVYINEGGSTFVMTGGTISGNFARRVGGGLQLWRAIFNMRGGVITGNIAGDMGGGLWYTDNSTFTKTGGTITGYKSDPTNGNVVKDEDGNVLARKGHAMYRSENQRKETTAGPSENFTKDGSGPWEQ
jgi:hypothetical protein